MKKIFKPFLVAVASFLAIAGVAYAASLEVDSLTVGTQGVGGVTFFNGTIINDTTTDSVANPVTFGDDVRVDGRLWRGATAGPSDSLPLIINDNLTVTGDLTVEGTLVAASVGEVISNVVGVTTAVAETTWDVVAYDVCDNEMRETEFTVTFTPTDATTGTWASTDHYFFSPGQTICNASVLFPAGDYSGSYQVVDDVIFAFDVIDPNEDTLSTGATIVGELRGNNIHLVDYRNSPHVQMVMTKSS